MNGKTDTPLSLTDRPSKAKQHSKYDDFDV